MPPRQTPYRGSKNGELVKTTGRFTFARRSLRLIPVITLREIHASTRMFDNKGRVMPCMGQPRLGCRSVQNTPPAADNEISHPMFARGPEARLILGRGIKFVLIAELSSHPGRVGRVAATRRLGGGAKLARGCGVGIWEGGTRAPGQYMGDGSMSF